jgi:ribosome-associated protein
MEPEKLKKRNFKNEFIYSTSRSSGPGGQNVNKLNTKVELRFNISKSLLLSEEEKEQIYKKLQKKINTEGDLILTAQSERTQLMNKKLVAEKFYSLISKALTLPLQRRTTRPTLASVKKRIEKKRNQGFKKRLRKYGDDQSD